MSYEELAFESDGEDSSELVIISHDPDMDKVAWEKMFHLIPEDELEVLVCMFLGLKPKEIVKVLQLENIRRFYNLSGRLRETYRKQKRACLAYNEDI